MAGRKKEFDEEEVLDDAMQLFWTEGMHKVGMREFFDRINISRYGLYNTFGSKEELFIKALRRYDELNMEKIREVLGSSESPLESVMALLDTWQGRLTQNSFDGCLINSTSTEPGSKPEEANEIIRNHFEKLENLIAQKLDKAVNMGELPSDTNARQAARLIITIGQGLIVMRQAAWSPQTMKEVLTHTKSLIS